MFSPRVRKSVRQTVSVTEAASSANIPIPGLAVRVARAGSYYVRIDVTLTADAVGKDVGVGIDCVPQAAAPEATGIWRNGGTIPQTFQVDITTVPKSLAVSNTNYQHLEFWGRVRTTGPATIIAVLSRSAGSATAANGTLYVLEEGL